MQYKQGVHGGEALFRRACARLLGLGPEFGRVRGAVGDGQHLMNDRCLHRLALLRQRAALHRQLTFEQRILLLLHTRHAADETETQRERPQQSTSIGAALCSFRTLHFVASYTAVLDVKIVPQHLQRAHRATYS